MMARPRLAAWLMALLLLVTMALYWPATRCDFVTFDDNMYVIDNSHVTSGLTLGNAGWALRSGYAANWHPVTWLSHMLDCQMFGLKPWGHHLTNVLLHALNAGLVFALLRQMTGATWRSLLVAALFAVHPLRVESVAWVSERKDLLSGCFGLLALLAYARYAESRRQSALRSATEDGSTLRSSATEDGNAEGRRQKPATPNTHHASRFTFHVSRLPPPAGTFYLLSLFFFALGLMSKPMLVTWPFVMLLLDYWPLQRTAEGAMRGADSRNPQPASHFTFHVSRPALLPLFLEKLPFFALSAISSVVTFVVQQRGGAMMAAGKLPLSVRSGNALISYCRYLGKLFRPADLAVFYWHPGQWPLGKVLLAGGLILGISVLVFVLRRRAPYLLVGWLWFLGTLVPVIGLVQVGDQAMADRYTYLPSLGVLVFAVWGAYELTRRWHYPVIALSVAGGAAIVLCLALTRQQIGYWKDGVALFRHALAVTENNQTVHVALGDALGRKGQTDEAIRQYQEILRLKPGYALAHNNLGIALVLKGQTDEAIRELQEAIRLKPGYAEAHYNLGDALGAKGQVDEAIREFQEAIRLKPDYTRARNNLGLALARKGQMDEAIRQFQEATRLQPDDAASHCNLGNALVMKRQINEAIRQFQQAIRLKPDYADAHNNLGNALAMKHQINEAIRQYQEATRLKPDYAEAHNNLGIALIGEGKMDEAIRHFQEAVRLKPDYAVARKNLNIALATKAPSSPPPGAPTNR
jgi:Flp pilus assembly protein TadD